MIIKVWLAFNDGAEGEIDLSHELYGEIFEPLKDKSFFKSFKLEGHTLSWKNGADFAPEFLREHAAQQIGDGQGKAVPLLEGSI